jgi:outer membrane protein assembly factor BamB
MGNAASSYKILDGLGESAIGVVHQSWSAKPYQVELMRREFSMKRTIPFVSWLGAVVFMPSLLFGSGCSGSDAEQVTFYSGPSHTGFYDSEPLRALRGLKWKYDTDAALVTSPPLLYKECLYFGDSDGFFHAVNVSSGKEKWKFNAGKTVAGPPTIYKDVAYWGCGAGVLYALDPDTGEELRRFETDGRTAEADGAVCFPPLVQDGIAYFTSHDSCLYALDVDTFKPAFKFKTNNSMCCGPSRSGDVIFFSNASGYVYAMDIQTNTVRWIFKAAKKVYHSPAIDGGVAYFWITSRTQWMNQRGKRFGDSRRMRRSARSPLSTADWSISTRFTVISMR